MSEVVVVPFKANAECRYHIPEQRHRAMDSADYDAALRQPDDLVHRRGDRSLEG